MLWFSFEAVFVLVFIICFKGKFWVYVLILTIKFVAYVYDLMLWYNVDV